MNKGLEALEEIKNYKLHFDVKKDDFININDILNENIITIEKELKDKEKTDKVLEIIKSCICDIKISYYEHLDRYTISLNHYSREISKEEYDLLKEVFYGI